MAAKNKKTANMSAVRKALGEIRKYAVTARDHSDNQQIVEDAMMGIVETVDAALAKPRRNCDVGTPKEQSERFYGEWCWHRSPNCPAKNCRLCILRWAQIPYEEGDENGSK